MSLGAVFPVSPALTELQATFTSLQPSSGNPEIGAPTDPFAVLLDAASAPASTSATPTALSGQDDGGASSMSELAALQTGATPALQGLEQSGTSGGQVVADAEQYLGVPYSWGGTSPTTGFDCSGFVQHVYGDLGISLPRTSQEQSTVGTPVESLADAEPGDLLFFEPGPAGPGHVAIYFGDGEMIDAPETGETVQVQQVPTDAVVGIRRVLADPSAPPTSSVDSQGAVQMGNVAVPMADAPLVEQSSASTGVPATLLAGLLSTESGFSPSAVSSAGAQGIAQFMPSTAAAQGINPFDPSQAIPGAASLLSQYYGQYGSWPLALAAYNAGPNALGQAVNDPMVENYVSTVLGRAGA